MDRREFLKGAFSLAALSAVGRLAAIEKSSAAAPHASGVTRRGFRDTTLPLLGFGMMRLPRLDPEKPEIDYAVTRGMIDTAMRAGVNYFDTAYMYHNGLSEKCVGELLSAYPRESYFLADKMPVWFARDAAGIKKIFNEQLSRCKTDYFDFYLLHSLDAGNWSTAEKFKAYEFLARQKQEGRIKYLGFSFHDKPELLQRIVDARAWDFAQIQLNYLDWELYRSKEQYEILTRKGIPVIVMEPLRGGALASLSPEAAQILTHADPDASVPSWALRYVASLPNVVCVLSGMSLPEHVKDNIKTFTPFKPLSDPQRETLAAALAAYRKKLAIPCTACRYCMPCPAGVDIPRIFGIYNQYKISGNRWQFQGHYNSLPAESRASECVSCGKCARHCPQHIDIPAQLKKIAAEVK